jgi:TolB-like protein/Flp pilus assembly protein TadD
MSGPSTSKQLISFGLFEVNLHTGELRKRGVKIRLQGQPFLILTMLLERRGEVVTRDELRQRLWPADTFVDFEHGLNRAINKLREALGDSAENPRFIETLPRRGYRLLVGTSSAHGPSTPAISSEPAPITSLAILPLTNVSTTPDLDYLCDGITETLIYSVAQLPSFRVMARSTSFRYKGTELAPQTIGRKLKVEVVLVGRVLQRAEELAIQIELVNVADGSILWGDQFNRKMSNILQVQGEIAKAVFEKLRLNLSAEELGRVVKLHTRRSAEGFHSGIEYFQKAIELDPTYALGHTGIADTYGLLGIFPYALLAPSVAMPRCKAAALRAIEIDPSLAEAHTSLAMVSFFYDWDDNAEGRFRRAIELNPGYSTAHQWYSIFLVTMGRFDEANIEVERARQLDPLSAMAHSLVSVPYYFARKSAECVQLVRKTIELEPQLALLHIFLGMAGIQNGEFSNAVDALTKACSLSPQNATAMSRLGFALAHAGRVQEAEDLLAKLDEMSKARYISSIDRMFIYLGLKRMDEAFECMRIAYEERADYVVYFNVEPALDFLRQDKRFREIRERSS